MKNKLTLILMASFILILSACAKQSLAPVQTINSDTASVALQTNTSGNKFVLGPHKGLLGVRQYYFSCNSSLLPTYYYKALRAHATYLKQHPAARITVQGFTSANGSREYNITIGERRADAVINYLRLQGVSQKQILEVSYGSELDKPFTGQVNTKNCRADVVYTAS